MTHVSHESIMKPPSTASPASSLASVLTNDEHMVIDRATLDQAWRGIGVRRVRARRIRRAWMATPVVAAIALVVLFVVRLRGPSVLAGATAQQHQQQATQSVAQATITELALANGSALPESWEGASAETVAFDDGSRLELSKDARLKTTKREREKNEQKARVDLALESGVVTFDIKPGGPRAWVIDAGNGTVVRVLGTRFTVTRDAHHVHVSVARGKVRVESPRMNEGGRDLVAGQDVDVDVSAPSPSPSPTPVTATVESLGDVKATTHARKAPRVQSTHIADSTPPPPSPPTSSTPPPKDRLAEADAARRAGQPREAVAILTSVVESGDSRAPLAAFTLGKIHAEELGEPGVAATWFERAIRLGLPGGLDEDAHARVVDCYGRAGRLDEAARAADRYEAKFRDGRHLTRVKRWKH